MKNEATVQTGIYVQETMKSPTFQGFQILHWGFVIAPILAGVDKFLMKLTDWTQYLWSPLGNVFGTPQRFMEMVGVIEIIAGFLVALKPKIGGFIVAIWLWGIIVNLLLLQNYYDIALRDFGLSLGALALSRLAAQFEHRSNATSS